MVGVGSGIGVGVEDGVAAADGLAVATTGTGVGGWSAGLGPSTAPSQTMLQNAATAVLVTLRQSGRGQVQAIAKAANGKIRKLATCATRCCHQGRCGGTVGGCGGANGG